MSTNHFLQFILSHLFLSDFETDLVKNSEVKIQAKKLNYAEDYRQTNKQTRQNERVTYANTSMLSPAGCRIIG